MDLEQVISYLKSMRLLQNHVTIWPATGDVLVSMQKLETQRTLTLCALALDLKHPLIAKVDDKDLDSALESILTGERDAVLKRDHSAWSNHVIMKHTKDAKRIVEEALDEKQHFWDVRGNPFPPPTWFLQPYLLHLMRLGEIRSYIVNGTMYYSVSTTPEKFNPSFTASTSADFIRPLSSFQ